MELLLTYFFTFFLFEMHFWKLRVFTDTIRKIFSCIGIIVRHSIRRKEKIIAQLQKVEMMLFLLRVVSLQIILSVLTITI